MPTQVSFKSRVCKIAIQCASLYNSYFVKKSYLLFSDAFKAQPYYIVEAEATNYLHLIGVSTHLSAEAFFNKCLTSTLSEDDFGLSFHGKDPKFSKGSIRQKILTIPHMFDILSSPNLIEENFKKNVVRCTIASSNTACTLGFIATPYARPMTLLRGDELDHSKARPLSLVLSKPRNDEKYSQVLVGSDNNLVKYYKSYKELITSDLANRISSLLPKSAKSEPSDQ